MNDFLAIVLSGPIYDSDYHFGIFKLFLIALIE
jgi:hypothetical protein